MTADASGTVFGCQRGTVRVSNADTVGWVESEPAALWCISAKLEAVVVPGGSSCSNQVAELAFSRFVAHQGRV